MSSLERRVGTTTGMGQTNRLALASRESPGVTRGDPRSLTVHRRSGVRAGSPDSARLVADRRSVASEREDRPRTSGNPGHRYGPSVGDLAINPSRSRLSVPSEYSFRHALPTEQRLGVVAGAVRSWRSSEEARGGDKDVPPSFLSPSALPL